MIGATETHAFHVILLIMHPARSFDAGIFAPEPYRNAAASSGFYGSYMPPQLSPQSPLDGLSLLAPAVANSQNDQHFASLAQFNHIPNIHHDGQKPTKGAPADSNDTDLNLFVDASIRSKMRTAMRSWSNLFNVADITAASAEYSVFSPRNTPFPSMLTSASAASQLQLPGLSHSSLQSSALPPYYPTSDTQHVWVPDILPAPFSASGTRCNDVLVEALRKRSRELNFAPRDHLEQEEVSDSGMLGATSKVARAPSLRPGESPFFLTSGSQDSCCKTCDGAAPVVDIYVPSVCECGTAIVGVWYRNRPYYTHWFRHPRYAALRCMLEQNRCKNKYRPSCGIHASVGLSSPAACTKQPVSPDAAVCHQHGAAPGDAVASAVGGDTSLLVSEDSFGAVMSEDELLAPKFMSLLCMFQLVKHLDAVGIIYPSTVPIGMSPPNLRIEHVKISAHIDCERSKGFVQYRWYCTDVNDLVKELASGDKHTKKAVGCCCLGHWKRKPPGRDVSKSVNKLQFVHPLFSLTILQSSQLIVNAALDVQNVAPPPPRWLVLLRILFVVLVISNFRFTAPLS